MADDELEPEAEFPRFGFEDDGGLGGAADGGFGDVGLGGGGLIHDEVEEPDFDFDYEESQDEDRPTVTRLSLLKEAWLNELGAPEILHYEKELVEHFKNALDIKEASIQEQETNLENKKENILMGLVLQMEMDRVRYVLTSYLRTRLKKIEKHTLFVLSDDRTRERLSDHEETFAKSFMKLLEKHLNNSFLSHIPDKFRGLDEQTQFEQMVEKPNIQRFVFMRVTEDVGAFDITQDGESEVELNKGDILTAGYASIRELLDQKKVQLI